MSGPGRRKKVPLPPSELSEDMFVSKREFLIVCRMMARGWVNRYLVDERESGCFDVYSR